MFVKESSTISSAQDDAIYNESALTSVSSVAQHPRQIIDWCSILVLYTLLHAGSLCISSYWIVKNRNEVRKPKLASFKQLVNFGTFESNFL